MNGPIKVQAVVHLFGGIVEDVSVFATCKEALAHLSKEIGEDFATLGDFCQWQTDHEDEKSEWRWLETGLDLTPLASILQEGNRVVNEAEFVRQSEISLGIVHEEMTNGG